MAEGHRRKEAGASGCIPWARIAVQWPNAGQQRVSGAVEYLKVKKEEMTRDSFFLKKPKKMEIKDLSVFLGDSPNGHTEVWPRVWGLIGIHYPNGLT